MIEHLITTYSTTTLMVLCVFVFALILTPLFIIAFKYLKRDISLKDGVLLAITGVVFGTLLLFVLDYFFHIF